VKKASGGDAENYDEIRYGVMGRRRRVIVEALTYIATGASDIRSYFTKAGGNLAKPVRSPSCSIAPASSNMTRASPRRMRLLDAASRPAPMTCPRARNGHEGYASQETFRDVAKALEASSRPEGGADLEAAEHGAGDDENRREAC